MRSFRDYNTKLKAAAVMAAAIIAALVCPQQTLAAPNYFSSKAAGTACADFLNLPTSARAAAMGGAYSAISDEASAIYWNPAGLVQIPKLSAVFMRSQYVADISYQYAAYAQRLSHSDVIGISALFTDIGTLDNTDVDGNKLGTFSPKDQVFTLSYSKAILEFSDKDMDVSVGIAIKQIHSDIVHSAKSYAGDFGIMTYNFKDIPYRLAVTVSNFGKGLRYDKEENTLPLTLKLGASVNLFRSLLFSTDAVFPKQNKPNVLVGTELATEPNELTRLYLRAGLNTQRLSDGLGGLSLGVGATLHFFSLDYAFVPMGDLGTTHRISITFDFPFRSPVFQRRDRSIFTKIKGITFKP
ncbi:MAG TPA: hypothetical protein DCL44_01890 [Elusimicrobia bacterium]|nr:hypothetical protein [Elusimicrobiota bacterium]